MRRIFYIIASFCLILSCSNSPKKDKSITEISDTIKNIFISQPINLDSCSIIVDPYDRTDFSIIRKTDKFGLINDKNQLLLPIEFDTIERPRLADYFFITKNRLIGVVTSGGILTVPVYYEHIEYDWKEQKSAEEDCFIVQKNRKLGSIDFHNKTIIPIEYDGISNWVEYGPEAHFVKKGTKYGIIDYNTGKLIIPVEYDGIDVHRGVIEIKKNNRYGVVSWKNEEIIPCTYDRLFVDLDYFGFEKNHKDRIFAKKDNVWYAFLMNGKLLKSNVSTVEIDSDFLKYKPDSNEYRYHLKDCMVITK